jgi:adenylate kinase family enzyme
MPAPTIYVIAGCNGAGKTTFAKEFLPHEVKCLRFYNADEVARGLSPLDPSAGAIKAGRVLLNEIRESLNRHETLRSKAHSAGRLTFARSSLRFPSATSWNSITSGSPTSNRQLRVCVVESEWGAIMFQFRTFAVGSSAA